PAEMEQLFLNLLLNAYDATPSGGAVSVALVAVNNQIVVTVSDSGAGISPESLEKIFEPFFTTKPRGSGLGLAISAGIVQTHRGRLRAMNNPGGGATFSVEIPAVTSTSVTLK